MERGTVYIVLCTSTMYMCACVYDHGTRYDVRCTMYLVHRTLYYVLCTSYYVLVHRRYIYVHRTSVRCWLDLVATRTLNQVHQSPVLICFSLKKAHVLITNKKALRGKYLGDEEVTMCVLCNRGIYHLRHGKQVLDEWQRCDICLWPGGALMVNKYKFRLQKIRIWKEKISEEYVITNLFTHEWLYLQNKIIATYMLLSPS